MPDLIAVFSRWWKFILGITLLATLVALIVSLMSPKEYLSTATALPANSVTADKARIFNNNIEALYSEIGTPDELDRMEGTATLDTIFIAAAQELELARHYGLDGGEGVYKAAMKLKKNSKIARSAYGELKVKVWDEDRNKAAALANTLMQRIQDLHQQLQNAGTAAVLQQVKQDYVKRREQYLQRDTTAGDAALVAARKTLLLEQLQGYEKMIGQYELSLQANAPVLLVVEPARASLWPDKPKTLQVVAFTFAAALAFSFLLALLMHSRQHFA